MKLQDFDFRVWNERENCYYEPIIDTCLNFSIHFSNGTKELGSYEKKENLHIELWSGLYDKNGKKIYVNDIIKETAPDGEIYIHQVSFVNDRGFKINFDDLDYLEPEELEVIGNIHENPELLKE